jgi:hypothetical protein
MNISFFKWLIALLLTLVSLNSFSREAVPIIDHIDVPVLTSSGNPLSSDQVRDAIISAAQARNWEVTRSPSQAMLSATLNVRGKHSVVVSIPYSSEKFSIKYANSTNMKYSMREKQPAGSIQSVTEASGPAVQVIHPAYNGWVQELLRSIQFELKKL